MKTKMISYDYELIYALGSMIGIKSREDLLKIIHKVETYGLDAMSTGVSLAWATEALERGLLSERDTIVPLKFSYAEGYLRAIDFIVEQPNDFYRALAQGVRVASSIYGGEEFALQFCGNEMPGYHTGYGAHLGYLTGLRHSHLDSAGYSIDQKVKDYTPETLVDSLVKEESWRQILSSLVVCFFSRGIYTPDIVSRAFKPLGVEITEEELKAKGEEIYKEKLRLKKELGFKEEHMRLPERVFETETLRGMLKKEFFEQAISYYLNKYFRERTE
jgi:aldehyde:ferredoxin oxidoreductase